MCFLGVPPLYSKRGLSRKSDALTFFPVLSSSSFLSCWCCVTVCSKGGRLFVGACGVLFVVMVSFHEASVYIPPLKIEPLFGNAAADSHVTCQSVFSPCAWLPRFISFFLSLFPLIPHTPFSTSPLVWSLRFFLYCLHSYSPHHLSLSLRLANDCSRKNTTDTW